MLVGMLAPHHRLREIEDALGVIDSVLPRATIVGEISAVSVEIRLFHDGPGTTARHGVGETNHVESGGDADVIGSDQLHTDVQRDPPPAPQSRITRGELRNDHRDAHHAAFRREQTRASLSELVKRVYVRRCANVIGDLRRLHDPYFPQLFHRAQIVCVIDACEPFTVRRDETVSIDLKLYGVLVVTEPLPCARTLTPESRNIAKCSAVNANGSRNQRMARDRSSVRKSSKGN